MFPLNPAPEKRETMLVTADVSHIEISPYVAVAVVESSSQDTTAVPMLLVVMAVVVSMRLGTSLEKEEV